MREFRAKTTKKENGEHAFNNVWVEGDLVVSRDKYYIHPRANAFQVDNELAKLVVMHEVIPETVGQFIGLTDKNGKKIFEGDIVWGDTIEGDWHKGVVEYNEDMGWYFVNAKSFMQYEKNSDSWSMLGRWTIEGNIHDNKELLDIRE